MPTFIKVFGKAVESFSINRLNCSIPDFEKPCINNLGT
ncbi:hypothetical protein DSOL_4240 [Desulfosporosinus metallidurans]|uniref:Uncharacterized protein n=1 Tax=Desulfosporosinus metallidurans TaxID=1888891 RepID=A0A1Q8QL91_9FIRM|nr:hypothetical protein DSOL_4240 [Desulfosporosinus metallidurans]